MLRSPRLVLYVIIALSFLAFLTTIYPPPSPQQPIPESINTCRKLIQSTLSSSTLPPPPVTITSITSPNNHHHTTYPTWVIRATYTAHSGPFDVRCTVVTHNHQRPPTTTIDHTPGSPFPLGAPRTNTQCLALIDAPHTSTLLYIAYQLERGKVADRRKLYHLAPCPPDPPSMSATPED